MVIADDAKFEVKRIHGKEYKINLQKIQIMTTENQLIKLLNINCIKYLFLIFYTFILLIINQNEITLFFDGFVFKSIYKNYNINWRIFDLKYQFLQGLGSTEFIYNLNISLPFVTSYFLNKLTDFDLIFLYHFFSYLLLFVSSLFLFSKIAKENKFYFFLIYFSFFFTSISFTSYYLRYSTIFSIVPHLIELNAYINLSFFFLIRSFKFEERVFSLGNYIIFIIIFFYITCFATFSFIFYGPIIFFIIILMTVASFKKKLINLKYFLILNLFLFLICIPNIIISFSNMLYSNAYFYSEIKSFRAIDFVSSIYQSSPISKIIYLLFLINFLFNFKNFFKENIIINIFSLLLIVQTIFFSIIYFINPNFLKLSPIYIEYNFLTIIALQSFLIFENINNKKKYIILITTIFCISFYSNFFMKFPDHLKINPLYKNDIIHKLIEDLNNEKFNGKFVNYNNAKSSEGHVTWAENVYNDLFNILVKFKNDFRILSSYNFQIPSLNFYSTNLSPVTFNIYKLMSSEQVKNERSSSVFDKINIKILDMSGVRYIIDNKYIEIENVKSILKLNKELINIHLYEISNFTNYKNPINTIFSEKIEEINSLILSKRFNPNYDVIIHSKKAEILNTKFSKLVNFSYAVKNNYINTEGISNNKVIVVLPFQFSNCFVSKNKNLIIPVNGGFIGIVFNKNLNDEIYYKQNVVNNFHCVLKDFFFFRKIYLNTDDK